MPETYDRCLGPALFAPFAAHVATMVAALRPRRVLELAAGTGIATAAMVAALPETDVTATDLNPAMVAWGAAHVPGARWIQADAQKLDFPDATYHLVVCQFGVMFLPSKPAAFAEVARVLTPGGTMVFTVWDTVEGSDFTAAMVGSLATVLPDDPPDFISRVPHGYTDPDQIAADVSAGGLRPVSVERVVLRGRSPSARAIAEGFCLGTPLRFALEERGSLGGLAESLGDEMVARLGEGPLDGDLTAFVVTAESATADRGTD